MIRTIRRCSAPVISSRVGRVEGFGLERSCGRSVVLGLLWYMCRLHSFLFSSQWWETRRYLMRLLWWLRLVFAHLISGQNASVGGSDPKNRASDREGRPQQQRLEGSYGNGRGVSSRLVICEAS